MEKFKADNLWAEAIKILDNMETPGEARNKDLTAMFMYELEQKIRNGELININITGPVRTGKSTVAQALAVRIKEHIKKYFKVERPMSIKNIVRDQNEYSRLVKRRPESFKHECDVIDEWAEMELTGYNSTIEEKYLKDFSDRQAARYYHRIACSPNNQTDTNAEIMLQTVPGSRTGGKTLLHLSYKLTHGEMSQPILIGYIIVNVKEILKAEWYKEYLRKKEEKWELMNKHNVKSPRELEYAQIILETYERIRSIAKLGLTKRKHFKLALIDEADKRGVWFSILGDKDVLETLEGMAEMTETEYIVEKKIEQAEKLAAKGKANIEEIKVLLEYKDEIKGNRAKTLERLYKLKELWEQYQKIQ